MANLPLEMIEIIIRLTPTLYLKPWFLVSKHCNTRAIKQMKERFPLMNLKTLMRICFIPHFLDVRPIRNEKYVYKACTDHVRVWSYVHNCFIFMGIFETRVHVIRCELDYIAFVTIDDSWGMITVVDVQRGEILTHSMSPELAHGIVTYKETYEGYPFLSPTGEYFYVYGEEYIHTRDEKAYLTLVERNKIPGFFIYEFQKDNFKWTSNNTFYVHQDEFYDRISREFKVEDNKLTLLHSSDDKDL